MTCKVPQYCKDTGAHYACGGSQLSCLFNCRVVEVSENELGPLIEFSEMERKT